MLFGLWGQRWGAAPSAYAALVTGLGSYALGAYVLEWDYPYLSSLAAALAAYALLLPAGAASTSPRIHTAS
jgi:hypothetical protein